MDFYSCEICKDLFDLEDGKVCLICSQKYCNSCFEKSHHYCRNCNTKILNKKFDKNF